MATPIEMPKLGNTVEECLITRWCKNTGDAVAQGEILAEIETDKATFELTAPVGGTLLGTFFKDGDLVPVFTNVCVVGTPGESIDEFRPLIVAGDLSERPQSAAAATHRAPGGSAKAAVGSAEVSFSPRARRFAEEHRFYPGGRTGTGPGGRILEEDLKSFYYESSRTSSLAERMIESGYEPRGGGSGTNRMVLSRDLSSPPLKMSTIRERIARRMRESLATTAQYTMNASADATGLISLRARIKTRSRGEDAPSISIGDMVVFCVIKALEAAPEVNAEFVDGKIYPNTGIHIGFACDTPRGLLVPVVRDSQRLTLLELSLKIKELTGKAIEGSITPDELSGGSFTVSNLGTYGIESFSPILNPPQVAILGVNTIELKPVRRNGTIEFVEHIGLSLTCDHQVIDGAPGARFLKAVKKQIENIESIVGKDI
jgi:pyruvate dehydrogenase E2 component (dihydrolipoamide acetyltransferase)